MLIAPYVVEALPQAGCDGKEVTRIDVRTYEPSSVSAAERATDAVTEATGLAHRRTHSYIVRAYVRLKVGEPCTEIARFESERMLRAQRFVASAAVRAIDDGPDRVRIVIDVVDEFPWVGSARFSGAAMTAASVGSINLRGHGLTTILGAERGGAYRPGSSIIVGQYGVFARPAFADLELHQRPLGGLLRVGVTEPFLTDGQQRAMQADFTQEVEYTRLVRGDQVDGASRVRRTSYSVGYVRRIGAYRRSRLIGLGGLLFMGTDLRSSDQVVIVSDSGLVTTADTELVGRYPNYAVGRLAATIGVRALQFRTVSRFEALRAAQDVGEGVELQMLVGPSIGSTGEARDMLFAGDLYLGTGGATSFASLRIRGEGRQSGSPRGWHGVVGSAEFSWYRLASETRTRIVTASVSGVEKVVLPVQLTFRDPAGGLIGFPDSREAGGRRAVLRVEQRHLLPWVRPVLRSRAAIAVGGFADVGKLWAGDVAYGSDSPVRASAGLSLYGSVPSTGKRVYRVDFAMPLNPERGGSRFVVRLSSGDRTGSFWTEPRDVSRARAGSGPPALTRW